MALASGTVGAAKTAMFAGSMAGAFGMLGAPGRALDPFMGTIGAIKKGMGGGRGLAGGIGLGAMALGGYMLAGSAVSAMSESLMQGAQEQMQINTMLSLQATRRTTPLMGGFGNSGMAAVGSQIRGMAGKDEWSSVGELTGLMGQGLQSGAFRGVGNVGQFQSKFRELVNTVKSVAQAFNTSLSEAMPILQQVQGMGFYGVGQAGGAAGAMAGLGGMSGLGAQSVMGAAGMGANAARRMGIHGSIGATMASGLAGRLGAGQLAGVFSGDALREMAGGAELGEAIPMIAGQLTGAAMQAGNTRFGNKMLGAMIDPETGHIDAGRATAFQMGALSRRDINRMYRKNMRNRGAKGALRSRRGSLMGELVSQVGAEGILGGYASAEMHTRGLKVGEDVGDITSILTQKFSGLGEEQAGLVQQLLQQGPAMKGLIQERLQQELGGQKARLQQQQRYSIEGLKRRFVQAYVDPVLGPMRDLGANIVNQGNEAFKGAVDWLVGDAAGPSATIPSTASGRSIVAGRLTGGSAAGWGFGTGGGGGGPGGDYQIMGRGYNISPHEVTGTAGLAQDFLGMDSWNQRLSATLGASSMMSFAPGRALWHGGTKMLQGAAGSLAPGRITGGFTGAGARSLAWGLGGFAARGAAGFAMKAVPVLGTAMMAWDLGVNVTPGLLKMTGAIPDFDTAIGGPGADALADLYGGGFGKGAIGFGRDTGGWLGGYGRADAGSVALQISSREGAYSRMGDYFRTDMEASEGQMFQVNKEYLADLMPKLFESASDPYGYLMGSERGGFGKNDFDSMRATYAANRAEIGRLGMGSKTSTEGGRAMFRALKRKVGGKMGALEETEANVNAVMGIISPKSRYRDNVQRILAGVGGAVADTADARKEAALKAFALVSGSGFSSAADKEGLEALSGHFENADEFGKAMLNFLVAPEHSAVQANKVQRLAESANLPPAAQKFVSEMLNPAAARETRGDWRGSGAGDGKSVAGLVRTVAGNLAGRGESGAVLQMQERAARMRAGANVFQNRTNLLLGSTAAAGLAGYQRDIASAMEGAAGSIAGSDVRFAEASRGLAMAVIRLPSEQQAAALQAMDPFSAAIGGRGASVYAGMKGERGGNALLGAMQRMDPGNVTGVISRDLVKDLRRAGVRGGMAANELSELDKLLQYSGATAPQMEQARDYAQQIVRSKEKGGGAAGQSLAALLGEVAGGQAAKSGGSQAVKSNKILSDFAASMNESLPKMLELAKVLANR